MIKIIFFILLGNITNIHSIHLFSTKIYYKRNYSPYGQKYYENYLKNLNSKNNSIQNLAINPNNNYNNNKNNNNNNNENKYYNVKINEPPEYYDMYGNGITYNNPRDSDYFSNKKNNNNNNNKKSENFEVIKNTDFSFKNIGGYDIIKSELSQCIDILTNFKKYDGFNVRVPKGLILEGPPGNGKTLIAKGFAGETNTSFIAVSGSQFQEKYVGVGPTRIRELFKLANDNLPCIIFIDEIDALGRKRSPDGDASSAERDNTLNELLVHLDGFKTSKGLFLIGATNRIDLLDPALLRPGRIDKKIYIGLPDSSTREAILNLHLKGKPHNFHNLNVNDLVDLTNGLSGSQIENLLNEAMLNALRLGRNCMEYKDIDLVMNKIMVGWQPTEHQFTPDILDRIAIHEMGHAIVGFFSKHHSKVTKVVINLSAPTSPGYTLFENPTSTIFKREALFEHLMILLAGRIAEEIFYDLSVTTGALNDFEEAFKLAHKMIVYYGMGKEVIYPNTSEKYKEKIDEEVLNLINDAYRLARIILEDSRELILECATILKNEKIIKSDKLLNIIHKDYKHLL